MDILVRDQNGNTLYNSDWLESNPLADLDETRVLGWGVKLSNERIIVTLDLEEA